MKSQVIAPGYKFISTDHILS